MGNIALNRYFEGRVDRPRFEEICRESGVSRVHVSLISGRCGSTLLAHMTSKAGFGRGQEPFNERDEEYLRAVADPSEFARFLLGLFRHGNLDGRLYFQITPPRLEAIQDLLPEGSFPFPDARTWSFIFRRNIAAQAMSYFNASSSGVWHSNQERSTPRASKAFEPEAVLRWIRHIDRMERKAWAIANGHFEPVVYFYEDIVSAPLETLHAFLDQHGFDVDPSLLPAAAQDGEAPRKLWREDYPRQYSQLLQAYPWLRDVLRERTAGAIPSPELERRLAR